MSEETKMGEIAEFKVKITIILCIIFVSMPLLLFFIFSPDSREVVSYFTALIGGAAIVYSAFYAGKTLKTNQSQMKLQRSYEISLCLNDMDTMKMRLFIAEEVNVKDFSPKEIYERIKKDRDLESKIRVLLNLFEVISISIQYEYADEGFLYKFYGFILPYTYKGLRPYIEEFREVSNDKLICVEFEKLAKAWEEGKSILTGKVLPI